MQKPTNFSIQIIDDAKSNSGIVTFTANKAYKLEKTTKHGGSRGEKIVYNIKGSSRSRSRISLATVKISWNTNLDSTGNRYFPKTSSLFSKDNIKLILKSAEKYKIESGDNTYREGVYTHTQTFDLVYINKASTSKQNNVVANLIYRDTFIPRVDKSFSSYSSFALGESIYQKITQLRFGSSFLSRSGEARKIDILGAPGATAKLTIKDDNGSSILDEDLEDATTMEDSNGNTISVLSLTIGASGKYSFTQNFPSIVSRATKVNGAMAASGTDKIIFDNLDGVKVGDKVILSASPDETTSIEVTALNPDLDNENECTVSPNLTAADNAFVHFKRSRTYSLNIETSSGLGSGIPTTNPTYTFYQFRDPILTLRAEGNAAYTITQFDGVATSLGTGTDHYHEKRHAGIAGYIRERTARYSKVKESIDFSYLLTASGGKTFTGFTVPFFNKSIKSEYADNLNKRSDWTNSVPEENGGTVLDIIGVSSTAVGSTTITISGTVIISRWGNKDVTMAIDLNKFLTYSS